MWVSEPGVTYTGAGIGMNLNTSPHGAGGVNGIIDPAKVSTWLSFFRWRNNTCKTSPYKWHNKN